MLGEDGSGGHMWPGRWHYDDFPLFPNASPPTLPPPSPSAFTSSPSRISIPHPLGVADALVDESYFTCVQLHSVALAFNEASARTAAVVRVGAVLRGVRVNLVGLLTLP